MALAIGDVCEAAAMRALTENEPLTSVSIPESGRSAYARTEHDRMPEREHVSAAAGGHSHSHRVVLMVTHSPLRD